MTVAVVLRAGEVVQFRTTCDLLHLGCTDTGFGGFIGESGHATLPDAINGTIEHIKSLPAITAAFFLDSDMRIPPTVITRLLAHDKDMVGASYRRRGEPHDLMSWGLDDKVDPTVYPAGTGLIQRGALPAGCVLIKRRVFEAMEYPYYRLEMGKTLKDFKSYDVLFCRDIRKLGFEVWEDTDLSRAVRHLATVELPYEWK